MKLWVLLAIVGCAFAAANHERIVGGSDALIQQYPYVANLQFLWSGLWWAQQCGGSLLTVNTVLSAAHCFSVSTTAQWRVKLGSSQASSNDGSIHAISSLRKHPSFTDEYLDSDIALVSLATPAVYSEKVGSISIVGVNYRPVDNSKVTAVGWGALWNEGPSSNQLQQVHKYLINRSLCQSRYRILQVSWPDTPDVTTNMICTGVLDEGGRDTCTGDRGGPIVHNNGDIDVLIGVSSWGRCGDPTYPSVAADVSTLSSWIVANAS